MVVAQQVPQRASGRWVRFVLTISKLKRWSINYYIDTAAAAEHAARDLTRASGGLGAYYSQRETRTPVWAGQRPVCEFCRAPCIRLALDDAINGA
jgi:hypothetical protein